MFKNNIINLFIMSNVTDECSNLRLHISEIARLLNEGDIVEVAERIHSDATIVRASGNPLTKEWVNVYTSQHFNMYMNRLLSINKIELSDDCKMGYVCYTMHSHFNYNSKLHDEISVYTAIFKKFDSDWMIVYMQKSEGRRPTKGIPVFK